MKILKTQNVNIKNRFNVFNFYEQRGMAALLIVIIIGGALLLIAYSTIFLSLGDLEMGYDSQRGEEAMSIADGCLEEALHRLQKDNSYSGGAVSLDNGTCTIIVSGGGSNRIIEVTSVAGYYTKKIQAAVSISGSLISIDSWQELTN